MAIPAALAALLAIGAQTAFAWGAPDQVKADAGFVKRGFHLGGFFDCDYLVDQGVIDQATADKIADRQLDLRIAELDEQKTELLKIKAMTREQRAAYYEEKKAEISEKLNSEDAKKVKTNPFDSLVADGIITQEQADAIKAALPEKYDKSEIFKSRKFESTETPDL
jgi:hypothetical protein